VDIASPINSVSWQTHSSPSRSAISIRSRFSSDSAFVMFKQSLILAYFANDRNMVQLTMLVNTLLQFSPAAHGCIKLAQAALAGQGGPP
jgi:hypothetical protein